MHIFYTCFVHYIYAVHGASNEHFALVAATKKNESREDNAFTNTHNNNGRKSF